MRHIVGFSCPTPFVGQKPGCMHKLLTLFNIERRLICFIGISIISIFFVAVYGLFSPGFVTGPLNLNRLLSVDHKPKLSMFSCKNNLSYVGHSFDLTGSEQPKVKNKVLLMNLSRKSRDRSLFQLHASSVRNKTIVPDICVALLSCRRIHHLRRTIRAIIHYFAKIEPNITYEIALLDNGSDQETVNEILNDFPIDIIILRAENVGIAEGLDTLFHGACRSPFILSLEDDWEARVATWPANISVMAMSMHVLISDPLILEIWLRDWDNGLDAHKNRTGWLLAPSDSSVMNGKHVMYRRLGRTPGSVWGGYTNGASLKHRGRLRSVGYMKVHSNNTITDFNGEYRYAVRVLDAGYISAHLCLPMWHPELRCDLVPANREPYVMLGLFMHIGNGGRSSGHADFHGIETIPG